MRAEEEARAGATEPQAAVLHGTRAGPEGKLTPPGAGPPGAESEVEGVTRFVRDGSAGAPPSQMKAVCLNISFLQSEFTCKVQSAKYYVFLFLCFNCVLVRGSPTRPGRLGCGHLSLVPLLEKRQKKGCR